jgi:hypothetical protein
MGLFGKKNRQQETREEVYSGYSSELSELLRLNEADDNAATDRFMERNLARPGFGQAVLDAGIDFWADDDFGSAFDLLQSLDLALIGHEDQIRFPDSMRAETKHYIAWCFALTGRESLAIDVWREAVELGSVEANYLLFLYLPEGTGLKELRAAAAAGHQRAIETLAEEESAKPASGLVSGKTLSGVVAPSLSLGASKLGASLSGSASPNSPSRSSSASGAFCEQCGTARSPDAAFCGSCGGRFTS